MLVARYAFDPVRRWLRSSKRHDLFQPIPARIAYKSPYVQTGDTAHVARQCLGLQTSLDLTNAMNLKSFFQIQGLNEVGQYLQYEE
ncbi:hypothetical protein D9M72_62390 [compost metagenome]